MSPGPREDDLVSVDVLRGLAARLNDTLAILLLNIGYLGDLVHELAAVAARPPRQADAVIRDAITAIDRVRDVVRDLEALAGDEHGDVAETFAAVIRLAAPSMPEAELIDQVRGPAPTTVPRRQLATISALAVGEIRRALAGCRTVITVSCDRAELEVRLGLRAAIGVGTHQLDGDDAAWRQVRALLAPHGGRLAIDRADAAFGIEIRLPAADG